VGFRFRYESLLSYRGHLKEKAEVELSRARQQLIQARLCLEEHKENLRGAGQSLESVLKNKISSQELKNYSDYLSALKAKIGAQENEVKKWETVTREKLENLQTKTKRYKVIEKLKEKDFQQWNYQQQLLEQKRMDEVAVVRHGKSVLEI
jgi:flagellar FliJ protein